MSKVVIVGQGYVGLPLAVAAARAGHTVIGYDVDTARIKQLDAGESYVEDISSETLNEIMASGHYRPSSDQSDLRGFDIAVITVPTPLREGSPDLSYIEASATTLARYLRSRATVVLESTTYPGTTEELLGPMLEDVSGLAPGRDFYLGYSPERIDPGNKTWDLTRTPKVVSGVDEESLKVVREFYDELVSVTVPVSSTRVAELVKLIENTFRHVNIALVNELAMYARTLGIDIWEAVDAAASKPFGFMPFTPGPGVGGHCLPIDPVYLSWRVQRSVGRLFRFVELANHINSHMPQYVVQRLVTGLNARRRTVNGSRILLLGLAYKPNTGDARESPALRIAQLLLEMGGELTVVDPHVVEPVEIDERTERVEFSAAELAAADAVLVVTDHDEFDYEMVAEHSRYVLDCRNRVPEGPNVEVL
ncbi:MAG TPA: nucleotide sugar dehydrogenase [Streptosporangiaceae bacterium]|nr:nucleotide sugar dehydrogenase [Streptosporangiaceae bacterium]